jgi:hypothetical protein
MASTPPSRHRFTWRRGSEAQLLAAVRDFCARSVPQPIGGLQVSCVGSSVAPTVTGDPTPINHIEPGARQLQLRDKVAAIAKSWSRHE